MRYLIDTHILLRYLERNNRLPVKLQEIVNDEDNLVVISIASLWELAIKIRKKGIEIKYTLSELEAYIIERDFRLLNVSFKHLNISVLPEHHGDPFDHMIISQAISENLTIISVDGYFKLYGVEVIS